MNVVDNGWGFYNPTNIIFAPGAFESLGHYVRYDRIVLVTSKSFRSKGIVDQVAKAFGERLIHILDDVRPNPDLLTLDARLTSMRAIRADVIIALGGGSCIDTAKVLAFMLPKPKEFTLRRYFLEDSALPNYRSLPVIAIPTTSGTGSEVTPFATVWDFELGRKYSVAGEDVYPVTTILDPELTYELPEEMTISSGLDVISHALESIWNKNANPITVALATESLAKAFPALRELKKSLKNYGARIDMLQASLLAGLAISKTRTALAHSVSYPLTTDFGLPHGFASSFTLPSLLRFNSTIDDGRLEKLAKSLTYSTPQHMADDIDRLLREVCVRDVFARHIPDLKSVMDLVGRMNDPMRADNNIRKANSDDIYNIVSNSLANLMDC